jgi:putative ABC transport system substrate-binding protein
VERRAFVAGILSLLAAPLVAEAQQAARLYRLGVLRAGDPTRRGDRVDVAIRQGLQQFGLVEGKNLTIEYRSAEGHYDRLPDLVDELIQLGVDAILALPTVTALAAKNRTKTIPIIFTAVPDPIGAGLVTSLSRPQGNVTGITSIAHDLTGKRLQLLKEVAPGGSVRVLANPANPNAAPQLIETKEAAKKLGLAVEVLEARDPIALDNVFPSIPARPTTAVLVLTDAMFYRQRAKIAQLALERRLPAIFELREFVDAGGLLSYGASLSGMFRQAATQAARILLGTKPADLPVEQPTKFELVINLKTAKALGLTIPPSVLARADEAIE